MLKLLVDIMEMRAAARKMNEALENYRDAINNVKSAAEELAAGWEGDAREAFVVDQDQAYNWYNSLVQVVLNMISEAGAVAQLYEDTIAKNKQRNS